MRDWQMAAILAALAAAPALAQPAPGAAPPPMHEPTTRAEAIAGVRAHFAAMDTNGVGAISHAEFDAARAAMHAERGPPPPEDATAAPPPPPHGGMGMGSHWFDRVDTNHDGKVTRAEAEQAAMNLFDMVDANHDGTISPDERHTAMEMMQAMHPHRGE